MFEFEAKQRKLTTYSRKTSSIGAYSIAQDETSLESPKQMRLPGWKHPAASASMERLQPTAIAGKLARPSSKKSKNTLWDGPSDDDETPRPSEISQKPPEMAAALASNPAFSTPSCAQSVPQHDISTSEALNIAGLQKKRKRVMVTRAISEAPRDIVEKVDTFEVPVQEKGLLRRAQSVEASRRSKSRTLVLAKKQTIQDIFDFPMDDEKPTKQNKQKSVSSKKEETETFDITMTEEEPAIILQPRGARSKETSNLARQGARAPYMIKKKQKDMTMEERRSNVAQSRSKEPSIFDFPSDEQPNLTKKGKASKPRESLQPAPRNRQAPIPGTNTNSSVRTRGRGQTNNPGPLRTHTSTRRTQCKAPALEWSKQNLNPHILKSPKAIPRPPKALPGVGWHPSLAIHSSPNQRLQQGSSAPAALFSMIREQPQSPPTDSNDSVTQPATPHLYPNEMDTDATPVTPPSADFGLSSMIRASASSQTPRQRQLWGRLLATEHGESPSDLTISRLNFKSTLKPPSITRASSDIPQTTFSRRSRLIDSLKASAPSVEEDDEDDTSIENPKSDSAPQSDLMGPQATFRTASTKVTYAQQRTFLREQNEEAIYDILADELNQQTSGYGFQVQNNVVEDSEPEDGQEAHPRGVHDLRAAGSKRRLLDELDHLVDDVRGMAVETVSARRSSLMELAEKLMEPGSAAIFLESGMDRRLIQSIDDLTDITFIFLAATTIALVADSDATLNTLDQIHRSKVFGRIVGLLSIKEDISKVVKKRRSNMSRIAQASVVDFKDAILKSRLFTGLAPTSLSPQLMALRCLDSVVRKSRDQGSRSNLVNRETIGKLLSAAQSKIGQNAIEVATLEPIVSILEAHTLSRSTDWTLDLVEMFVQILPPIFGSLDPALQHSKFLALRLSLNLTNENSAASDIFSLPALITTLLQSIHQQYELLRIKVASEEHAVNVDNTVLALGVMINLAEHSDLVRFAVLDGDAELLAKSVRMFLESKELTDEANSVEEVQTNVAFGYLAFVLGNLCQDEKLRNIVRRKLPGGKLTLLLEEMQKFTTMHRRADKVGLEGAEGEELERGYTQRLQALVNKLAALDC